MVLSIAFNSKGTQIASGSHDTSIKLWDLQTGTLLKTFHPVPPPYSVCFSSEGGVNSVAFSPDGSKLASASREETHSIMIWDIHTGSRVETLIGHTDWVNSVAFSPNGKQLISGSSDDTFKLWNMENDSGK
jgi:WD40 repeat protein